MNRLGPLLIADTLILASAYAIRPDWIEATLFTVDASGVWSGNALRHTRNPRRFVLELAQEGSKVTGSCVSSASSDELGDQG